jgi:hypothetical protein
MSLARISPASSREGRQLVDIVEKMSVPISNFAHIAAGEYKCGSGFKGSAGGGSGVSKE